MNEIKKENDTTHVKRATPANDDLDFLSDGGTMGALIRAHDWTSTLGAPRSWPHSLRTAVRLMLTTNHPVFIFWGPDNTCLYNDAFSESLGPEMHPVILGSSGRDAWQTIWSDIHSHIEWVMSGHGLIWQEDKSLTFYRHGELEEMFWTYSSSPIDDEQAWNGIGGVLVLCVETTPKVVALRHQEFRLRLEATLRELSRPADILAASTRMLGEFLQARRCGFAEAESDGDSLMVRSDWTDGQTPRLSGRIHPAEFGPDFIARSGNAAPICVEDPLLEGARMDAVFAAGTRIPSGIAMPLLRNGRVVAAFYAYRNKRRRWTEQHELLIRDVAERTQEAVERARVAAERDRLTAELRDSEARYRGLVEASAAIVWRSASGEFDTPQPSWSAYTGQSFEELKGWGWLSAVHPADQDRVADVLGRAFEAESDYEIEYCLRRHDGVFRSMAVHAITVKNKDGVMQGWVGTHTDVSAARKAIPSDATSQLTGSSDFSPQVTWMAGPDGQWQYLSDLWHEWTGTRGSPQEWSATIHPEERDLVLAAWQRAVIGGATYDMEYRIGWSTGDYRWVHAHAQPQRDAAGRIVSWSGTIEDIHDWLVDHDISHQLEPVGASAR